ncbi:MAG: hypothetical protein M1839_008552 [Geoglossum umbratile]|nr:MAG: hypothetical protein M1839_008552 [Geoglossum umbratile]
MAARHMEPSGSIYHSAIASNSYGLSPSLLPSLPPTFSIDVGNPCRRALSADGMMGCCVSQPQGRRVDTRSTNAPSRTAPGTQEGQALTAKPGPPLGPISQYGQPPRTPQSRISHSQPSSQYGEKRGEDRDKRRSHIEPLQRVPDQRLQRPEDSDPSRRPTSLYDPSFRTSQNRRSHFQPQPQYVERRREDRGKRRSRIEPLQEVPDQLLQRPEDSDPPRRPTSLYDPSSRTSQTRWSHFQSSPQYGEWRREDRGKRRSHIEPLQGVPDQLLQPPEDSAIHSDVSALGTFIFQHSASYYQNRAEPIIDGSPTWSAAIRRYIGQIIIASIIMSDTMADIRSISNDIADILQPYIKIPEENRLRRDHLHELCKHAETLRGTMSYYPAKWSFGSWESPEGNLVLFPSLLKDGDEVVSGEVEATDWNYL